MKQRRKRILLARSFTWDVEYQRKLESFVDRKYRARAGTDLNSGTAKILDRTGRLDGSGRARRCERSFAAGCRIGWLISHSHDYIGEMENIYIRARGEPRVSDWVRYSGNKKV